MAMGRRLLALLLLLARLVAQPLPETTGFRARRSLEGSELFIPAASGCPCPDGCRTLTSPRGTLGDGFWPRCEAAQAGGMYRNMEEMREICWWVIDARTGRGDSGALLSFTALQTDLSVGTDSINVYECSDIDCSGNSEIYYTPEVQQALQGQLPSDGATYTASTGIFYVRFQASLWRASTGFGAVWAQQSQDGDGSCGNGVLDGVFEACDDGGLDDGDGCSSECKVERGWNCSSGTCACTCCGVDARTEGEIVRMGGYSENERCDMTVGNGSNLGGGWLAVTKLSTQPMHDNLTVWACADASCSSMGSPLAVLSGGDASEGVGRAYRSDAGVFRLRFESDGCINEGGFSVRWSDTQPVCNDTVVHWLEGCDPPGPRCSDTCGLLHPGYDCESARSVGGACTPATTCGDGVVAAGEEECEGSQGCSGCMCAAGGAGGGCDWTAPAHIDVGSAVAAAGEGDVIRFKEQIALLDKARHLVVSSKNVTLIASGEGRGLPFGGYGASISVLPGAALTMEGFQVSGGLTIEVAEGGALALNSMAIDHVRIQQTRAKVTMFNCTVEARYFYPDTALHVRATGGSFTLEQSKVEDSFDGIKASLDCRDGAVAQLLDVEVSGMWQTGQCMRVMGESSEFQFRNAVFHDCWSSSEWGVGGGRVVGGNGSGLEFAAHSSKLSLNHVSFLSHFSDISGGGMHVTGSNLTVDLEGVDVLSMTAQVSGGGIFFEGSRLDVFVRNLRAVEPLVLGSTGGGIFFNSSDGKIRIESSVFTGCEAMRGGGAYLRGGSVTLRDVMFDDNKASEMGGGAFLFGSSSVENCTFKRNKALAGGGVVCYGDSADLQNVSLDGNFASETGGGFLFDGSGLWFPTASVADLSRTNDADFEGHAKLTLRNVETVRNHALRGDGGGGVSVGGCIGVLGGLVSGNSAATGGGISIRGQGCHDSVASEFVNVVVKDNSALSGGGLLVTGDVAPLSHEPLYESKGIPFWLDYDPRFVSSRIAGNSITVCNIDNNDCPVFPMSLAEQSPNQHPHPLAYSHGERYIVSGNPYEGKGKYVVWDLSRVFEGIVVSVDEIEADTIQYQVNEVPGVASANVLTDFHPGWGACGSASPHWVAASLFKSVILFNVTTLKLEVISCLADATALAADPEGDFLFAAVWDSDWGVSHIVRYDVAAKTCTKLGLEWGMDHSGDLLSEYKVIRAMEVSGNRQFLYVVEQLRPMETLYEEMQLMVVSIESGLRRRIAATSKLFNVAYIRVIPLPEGGEKLRIVCQKKDESENPTTMFYGPWIYQIYDFNQLVVNVSGVMISDNRATSGSGGGLLMVDYSPLAAISVSGGEIVRNSASAGGGGVHATSVWGDITGKNVKISNNSAAVGAGGLEAHFSVKLSLMNVSVIGNHGPGIVFTDEIILGQNAYELGGSELYVSGSKVMDNVNEMDGWGGGMLLRGGVMAKVTRCDFEGNRAKNGGAVAVVGQGGLDLLDVAIRSNEARECGGGVAFTSLTSLSYGQNLILESNRGLYGGGMCYMPPSAAGVSTVCYPPGAPTHLGLSASSSLAASPASLGVVRLVGNVADASGGGLYLRCKGLPEVIKDAVMDGGAGGRRLETGDVERRARNSNMSSSRSRSSSPVGQRRVQQASFSLNGVSYEMSDNVARYGESIGTIQEKMSMLGWGQATSISFVPGDALLKEIVLTDGFGQVIKTKEGIVVAEMLVMGEDGGFTVHHRHFYEFDDDGRCLLDQEAAWPLKNGQGTEFMDSAWLKLRYQPGIVETDGSMLSGSTTDLSLSMQVIPLERLSCMEGTSFTRVQGGSGVCVACQRDQYVVSPDYSPCMQCAIGGECDGSNLKGLLEGSKWTREGQEMRLVECPPGSIIVRDTIAVLDECIVCPQQTFSDVTARWEQGKGQLVSLSASQASLLCTTCLPHRKCQGSQNLPLDTRIWITPKGEAGPGPEQLESLEASAGECFEKMAECDTLRQRETVVISIADAGAGPTRFKVQWREIDDGGTSGRSIDAQPSVVQQGGSNLMYVAEFTPSKVSNYLIEILRNGISLPNSPLLLRVEQALCPTFQTPDDQGICRCSGYETEALGCIGSDTLIAIIIVPVIFLLLLVACIFTKYSIDQADKVWQIEKSEITFDDDPPTVLGKGVHGQVLLGEYRGTACAVKTIVPERTESRGDVKKSSVSSRSQAQSPTNNHSTNLHQQQQQQHQLQHQHQHHHHHQRVETDVRGLAASDQNNVMPPFGARPNKDEDYDDYDDDDDAVDRFGQKIIISRTASGSSMQSSSHAHPSDNQGARHPALQRGHSQSSDLASGSSHAKKSVNQNQQHGMDSALEMTLDQVSGSHGAFGRPHNGTMDDKQVSASKNWLQSKVWRTKSRLKLWVNNRASRMLAKLGHKKSTEHVSRVDALLAEMRVLIKLRHPNITTIMGAVVNDVEFPWLVMEYMQKGSLLSLLKSEDVHLDNKHLIKLAADIVHGMRFLHASSPPIIHGDLKCANVLVDSAFHAKVTDFGYAKQMQQPGKVVGSPFFMAPELLTGGHWHSCASDVYAFGIMLYEMFAQQSLYPGPGDVISILRQIIHQDRRPILPPRLRTLDREDPLKSIVSMMTQCWEKEVSKRPTFEEMDKCSTLADHIDIASTPTPGITPIQSGLGDQTLMMSHRSDAHLRSPVGRANSRSAVAIKGPVVPPRIMEALMRGQAVGPEHHVCVSLIWLDASAAFEDLASFFETLHAAAARFDVFLVGNAGEGGDGVVAVSNMHKKQDDHALRIAAFAISLREEAKMPSLFKASVSAGPLSASVAYSDKLYYVISGKALLWAQDIAQFGLEGQIVCLPDFQEAASHQTSADSVVDSSRFVIERRAADSKSSDALWVVRRKGLAHQNSKRSRNSTRSSRSSSGIERATSGNSTLKSIGAGTGGHMSDLSEQVSVSSSVLGDVLEDVTAASDYRRGLGSPTDAKVIRQSPSRRQSQAEMLHASRKEISDSNGVAVSKAGAGGAAAGVGVGAGVGVASPGKLAAEAILETHDMRRQGSSRLDDAAGVARDTRSRDGNGAAPNAAMKSDAASLPDVVVKVSSDVEISADGPTITIEPTQKRAGEGRSNDCGYRSNGRGYRSNNGTQSGVESGIVHLADLGVFPEN